MLTSITTTNNLAFRELLGQNDPTIQLVGYVLILTALSIVAGSALRLAKFNIDTEQSETFKGPTHPGLSHGFLLGLFFFYAEYQESLEQFAATPFYFSIYCTGYSHTDECKPTHV